jgi:4-hydroxy-3-methylbut-2-enyl diphosphate reductase
VVGGRSSNNTRELVQTCARYCARVHHVQTDADVRPEWFDAAKVVGLTAGTSTPDDVIDRVEARIRQAGARAARTLRGGVEVEARTRSVAGVAEGLR